MSNELMSKASVFEVNGEEVKLSGNIVKQYLVHGNAEISDQEVVMFINLCKFQKLNPFLNEAYLIKFGSKPAQIIVSKEAFMKRAESHPKYEGLEAGIIVERNGEMVEVEGAVKLKNDFLIGGWCKVYRADRKVPITVKISLNEFSKGQATWKDMPLNMIRKTAVVNALRESFPESLNALYTEEEVRKHDTNPVQEEVQEEIKQHANSETLDVEPNKPKKEQKKESEVIDIEEVEENDEAELAF